MQRLQQSPEKFQSRRARIDFFQWLKKNLNGGTERPRVIVTKPRTWIFCEAVKCKYVETNLFLLHGLGDEGDEDDDDAREDQGDWGEVEEAQLCHKVLDHLWPIVWNP